MSRMDLQAAKVSRENGKLSREDYWGLVKTAISSALELSSVVAASDSTLTVSEIGMVLNYPITPHVKLKLFVDGSDTRSIGVSVIAEGRYEPVIQKALLAVSQDCLLFADIGANVGFYSLAVRATNPSCEVIAFECNPEARVLFNKNIKLNGLDNITIRAEALSNKTGDASFHVPSFTGSGGGSLRNLHPEEGEPKQFQVSLMPLDSLQLEKIDLMKIDVEGAELDVIKGALSSITRSHPTIFMELLRKWMKPFDSSPREVSELLAELGYLIFEVGDETVRELDQISEDTSSTNFIFAHVSRPEHSKILRGFSQAE